MYKLVNLSQICFVVYCLEISRSGLSPRPRIKALCAFDKIAHLPFPETSLKATNVSLSKA